MSESHRPDLHETDASTFQNPSVVPSGSLNANHPAPPTGLSSAAGDHYSRGLASETSTLDQEQPLNPGVSRHGTEHVGQTGHLEGASSMDVKKHNLYGRLERAVGAVTSNQEMKTAGQAKITESVAHTKGAESNAAQAA